MMSAAVWGPDTARIGRALGAVRDSVDRPGPAVAFDSLRREIRRQTNITVAAVDVEEGEALDRAALMLAGVADSALLDVGGQYLWVGPRGTKRTVGVPSPKNSLDAIATVELRGGSVSTSSHAGSPVSVTVLAPSGVAADAWSTALSSIGCDSALALASRLEGWRLSVVCADSAGVRWTADLEGRVLVPDPNGSRRSRVP
jgi:thiamine biosynthesis lipoprotein ApbE